MAKHVVNVRAELIVQKPKRRFEAVAFATLTSIAQSTTGLLPEPSALCDLRAGPEATPKHLW
jgi:hypothetical protein